MKMGSLRVSCMTYNVGKLPPPNNCSIDALVDGLKLNQGGYDLIVINLQEGWRPFHLATILFYEDAWAKTFRDIISSHGYTQLYCTWCSRAKLLGIMVLVFVRTELLLTVDYLRTYSVKTGIGGFCGNKGSVSVEVFMMGSKITFVNSHFEAHKESVNLRVSNFETCRRSLCLDSINENGGYTVFAGDLNFRIDHFTAEEALQRIKKGNFAGLLQHDQLKKVQAEGRCLVGYEEAEITFAPSYKFRVGSSDYDLKRIPAWCDRILLKKPPPTFRDINVKFESYESLPDIPYSDHKPVVATFQLSMPFALNSGPERPVAVAFYSPSLWLTGQNNQCEFSFNLAECSRRSVKVGNKQFRYSWWDWVGLFAANTTCDCDPLTWQYMLYSWESPSASGAKDDDEPVIQNILFKARYLQTGTFRLGYFSREFNCLIGLSNIFQILPSGVDEAHEIGCKP